MGMVPDIGYLYSGKNLVGVRRDTAYFYSTNKLAWQTLNSTNAV